MIELQAVRKTFGGNTVVDGLSLTVERGCFMALIGPSGCGKSTTLRMINRLIVPDSGTVRVDGRDIASAEPTALRRSIGYAIQAVGLFPHWTVARNIATVPRLLGWPETKVAARVDELLHLLGLPPERFANVLPAVLSGGQQQRVGVARALAADPPLLLMDEPFGALDPITRAGLQIELRRIQRSTGKTIVFVTHDIDEALLLADRIAIMDRGKLVQDATPLDLLQSPASDFVRNFTSGETGSLRLLAVKRVRDTMRAGASPDDGSPTVAADASLRDALAQMVAARSSHLRVLAEDGAPLGRLDLTDIVA